ncbi:hypothetical protein BDV59DRAFT_88847 [Aspergillus ambiguus]|uniref:uncharacterized protein n=1 Tax=Aspergillus ambiguus TaxID=176160 RepID=UPI003CCD9D7D
MATKRKSGELLVPDITEDPAERKRVLNVLAQRRYRKRKRERLESLQAQIETHDRSKEVSKATRSPPRGKESISRSSEEPHEIDILHGGGSILGTISEPEPQSSMPHDPSSYTDLIPQTWSPSQMFSLPSPTFSPRISSDHSVLTIEPLACLSPPPLLLEPFERSQEDSEEQSLDDRRPYQSWYNLSDQLQMHESSTFTFSDEKLIQIPSLAVLNAAVMMASRLKIKDALWDITATSPWYQGKRQTAMQLSLTPESLVSSLPETSSCDDRQDSDQVDVDTLPEHFRPTPSQRLIPHHPIIDLLPWPSARDRLIQVFALPVAMRPKAAQDPMGVFRFAYDMEDTGGEGFRIRGPDPFDQDSCEIGQLIFERWWWAFDPEIVEHSDRARRKRGEKGLKLQAAGGTD